MPLRNWYKDWFNSTYYHLLYQNRNKEEANELINNLLQYLKPAVSSAILDVACGKGRNCKILADKGFDVTGIDLTKQNIESAKQFEYAHLHFFIHNMCRPFYMNCFDIAFNFLPYLSFSEPFPNIAMLSEPLLKV